MDLKSTVQKLSDNGWNGLDQADKDLLKSKYDKQHLQSLSDSGWSGLSDETKNHFRSGYASQAPTGYSYLPGDYEDLRKNVGEVGYSGLDERQKALFKSQFPQSKFAKAGGSFEDAIKYVDSQSTQGLRSKEPRESRPMTASEMTPFGMFGGAPIPMTPTDNEWVRQHPGTTAAIGASSFLPFSLLGIAGAGGLSAGGTAIDEKLAGNKDVGESSLVSGIIGGLTHGIGGAIANRLGAFASKYLTPAREYPEVVARIEAENAKTLAEHEARQAIASSIDKDAERMAREYVQPNTEEEMLSELPNGLSGFSKADAKRIAANRFRTYNDADELAGLHKLEATKKSMWLEPNGPMDTRWKEFGGAGEISDDAAETYYKMVHAPAVLRPIPTQPAGVDIVKVINPYPGTLVRGVGEMLPESIRNAQLLRNSLWPAYVAEGIANPVAQGIKASTYPVTGVAKAFPEAYREAQYKIEHPLGF